MKALPSIAFGEFTGTAGEVTARSVHGQTYLSHKAHQPYSRTPAQAVSRNTLSKVSRAYRQLTDSQMKAWGALAERLRGVSVFGQAAELTAHNAFVRLNINRDMVGLPLLEDAPEYSQDIPAVTYEEIWVTPKRILFTGVSGSSPERIASGGSGNSATDSQSPYKLMVRMSAGQGAGVSSGWGKAVTVTPGIEDDWGDAGLTQLYTSKIGFMPSVGQKVFIEMCWLYPDTGFEGPAVRTVRVCITEEEAHERGFEERRQITAEMLVNADGKVRSMNLELPGGTGQLIVESSYVVPGYSFLDFLKDTPEESIEGATMVFGRSSTRPDYMPGITSIAFSRDSGKQMISISNRAGGYDGNYEIFGSSPMMLR